MEHDDWYCEVCEKEVPNHDPEYCCNGYECGCGGGPQVQCFCSDECADIAEKEERRQYMISREVGLLKRIRIKRLWKEVKAEQDRAFLSEELPDTFTQWPMAIKAAVSDINVVKYKMRDDGHGGTWIFGDCVNFADHTYHGYKDRQQQGFAGRHITFNLVDGSTVTLKGPFKTQPPKDMKASYLTRGVIAAEVSNHADLSDYFGPLRIYSGVMHLDREWVNGDSNRIEKIAQRLANERGSRVAYRSETEGGATSGWMQPQTQST